MQVAAENDGSKQHFVFFYFLFEILVPDCPDAHPLSSVRPPGQATQMLPTPLRSIAVRAQLLQRYCTVYGLPQPQLQLVEARMTPAPPFTKTT